MTAGRSWRLHPVRSGLRSAGRVLLTPQLARRLLSDGFAVWVLGGPGEKALAAEIVGESEARDLTGNDLREAIFALAAASVAVSNDSGLLHVAAALGTPSIGIFGPTSPWHWAPLNPLAAVMQAKTELACRPCHKPVCRVGHHRCMGDLTPEEVLAATRKALAPVSARLTMDRLTGPSSTWDKAASRDGKS